MGFVIAVDGPAASGKGTIATRLAEAYGYPALDSGLLYRAVGVRVLAESGDLSDEAAATRAALGLNVAELENPEVRTRAAGEAASRVAISRLSPEPAMSSTSNTRFPFNSRGISLVRRSFLKSRLRRVMRTGKKSTRNADAIAPPTKTPP